MYHVSLCHGSSVCTSEISNSDRWPEYLQSVTIPPPSTFSECFKVKVRTHTNLIFLCEGVICLHPP